MKKVFIDGSAGTTGLRIFDRLHGRTDIQLLTLPESERKLESSRKRLLNEADVVFLCLPDDAAREAASWVENPDTVVLDTSTAHRTAPAGATASRSFLPCRRQDCGRQSALPFPAAMPAALSRWSIRSFPPDCLRRMCF